MHTLVPLKRHRGFTLIEILVVLFIISIVTGAALLTIGRNESKQMEAFANEISQLVSLAEEQALLQPTVLGMSVDKHSVQFAKLNASDNKKQQWVALQDAILKKHALPQGMEMQVEVGKNTAPLANEVKKVPQIIISTNGEITPFTIYIGKAGEKPRYAVIGNADGHITSKSLS